MCNKAKFKLEKKNTVKMTYTSVYFNIQVFKMDDCINIIENNVLLSMFFLNLCFTFQKSEINFKDHERVSK